MWVRLTALAVTIALLAAVWIPAGAPARDGSIVCDSAMAPEGRCDARRPAPSMVVRPASPRAGTPVVLSATSPGRGVTFAWDLDADGAFERTGATVSTVFAAGPHPVAVRATDAEGRVGVETRTLEAHAANARPGGRLRLVTPSPHNATTTELLVGGEDPDGHVALIEFDVHGDGVYDDAHAFGPGEIGPRRTPLPRPDRRSPHHRRAHHRRRRRDDRADHGRGGARREPAAARRARAHPERAPGRGAGDRLGGCG